MLRFERHLSPTDLKVFVLLGIEKFGGVLTFAKALGLSRNTLGAVMAEKISLRPLTIAKIIRFAIEYDMDIARTRSASKTDYPQVPPRKPLKCEGAK